MNTQVATYQIEKILGHEVAVPYDDPLVSAEQIKQMFERPYFPETHYIIVEPALNLDALSLGIAMITGQTCRQVWTTSMVYTTRFAYVGYIPFGITYPGSHEIAEHNDPPIMLSLEASEAADTFNRASWAFTEFWVETRRRMGPGFLTHTWMADTLAMLRQAMTYPLIGMHPTRIEAGYVVSTLFGRIARGFGIDQV